MNAVIAAIIAACAAIAGGGVSGIFALTVQRRTREADRIKWEHEAAERNRTHFHDRRLEIYAEFLTCSSNAFGFEGNKAIERRRESDEAERNPSSLTILKPAWRPGDAEFNEDALRRMGRQETMVKLVTGSPEVRDAAARLIRAVIGILMVDRDDPAWDAKMRAAFAEHGTATDSFMEAARIELTD